jgi:molybdate transport system substrate-binding protein
MRQMICATVLAAFSALAGAAEILVFCPGAVNSIVTELAQGFQAATGNTVKFEYGTAGGLQKRAAAGGAADVVIVTAGGIDELAKQGRIVAATRRDIGRVGVAVAVRTGAGKPDISTPEAFKQAMLGAKSVMYADPALGGQSGIHTARVFERLGIAEAMKLKTQLRPGAPDGLKEVAAGDIEIGIGQMSEIAAAKGVALVGPLPAELQNTLTFSAGRSTVSAAVEAADAFIAHLTGRAARQKFAAAGFEAPQ